MNTFIKTLNLYAPLIEQSLHENLPKTLHGYRDVLWKQQIHDFVLQGGKRLRPVLAMIMAEELGFTSQDHLDVFCSLEIFHDFILAHDDIIDQDVLRWNNATMWHAMSQNLAHRHIHNRIHFGQSQAIIAGDILATIAQDYILKSTIADHQKLQLIQLLSHSFQNVAHGWYMQFLSDYMPVSELSLDYIIQHNLIEVTSSYSFVFPLRFGQIIAGGELELSPALRDFAYHLGILFQVSDDLIGLFGDEGVSGKSNIGDIIQGKKTIPVYFAYHHASESDQIFLNTNYGAPDLSDADIARIKDIIKNYGLEATETFLMHQLHDAKNILHHLPYSRKWKQLFLDLLDYLMKRKT